MTITARTLRYCSLALAAFLLAVSANSLHAQGEVDDDGSNLTESGRPEKKAPRDNFYDRYIHTEKRILEYDFVHEKDVFWEKRVWRLIDVREKMNHRFKNDKEPFVKILIDAVNDKDIIAYSGESFEMEYTKQEIDQIINRTDTIMVFDPETFSDIPKVVSNEMNLVEDIRQFRMKEVWFFDEEISQLEVRILGIAPLYDKKDDNGNVVATLAMFWTYYPDCREVLAKKESFNEFNDAQRMSWDAIFEARMFSSYIYKESNVFDRQIRHYKDNTADLLLEAEKIKDGIFHFEHDLWEY